MTDEERQRQMDFILEQQAQFAVNMQKSEERQAQFEEWQAQFEANMQKLEEADGRANKRIDRMERVLGLAIRSYRRERKETREKFNALIDAQTRTEDAVAKLAESHAKLAESHTKLVESHAKLAESQAKLVESQAKLAESQAKLAESQAKLAESQTHADKRLDALIDIVQDWKQ